MNIIDGKLVAEKIKEELKEIIVKNNFSLSLVVIQIGEDEASNIYIKQKEKVASYLGIKFKCIKFSDKTDEFEIEKTINSLNNDINTTGLIIQLPIPDKFNKRKLINLIDPNKDIDGLTDINKSKLINKENGLVPCTPLGIIKLLEYYNIEISGKNVVIVGRSELVGRPLSNSLINMDATVTLCHSKTKNLEMHTKNADILISATGKKHLIKKDMVKKGSIVIDVGITKEDGKLYGDVDFDNVKDKVEFITPVPGGVGPMTVIMLMSNVIKSFHLRKNES